jgi:hypothetical protein
MAVPSGMVCGPLACPLLLSQPANPNARTDATANFAKSFVPIMIHFPSFGLVPNKGQNRIVRHGQQSGGAIDLCLGQSRSEIGIGTRKVAQRGNAAIEKILARNSGTPASRCAMRLTLAQHRG